MRDFFFVQEAHSINLSAERLHLSFAQTLSFALSSLANKGVNTLTDDN